MNKPILIVGGVSVDTVIQLDALPQPVPRTIWPKENYRTLGSTGAGKALNLAALGRPVTLHSLLGQDPEAGFAESALGLSGIELQHVNLMDPLGERVSLFVQPPAEPAMVDWARAAENLSLQRLYDHLRAGGR